MRRIFINPISAIFGILIVSSLAFSCKKNGPGSGSGEQGEQEEPEEEYEISIIPQLEEPLEIRFSASYRFSVSFSPETVSKPITWNSEDENIAVVDEEGVVTATGLGETNIIASTGKREAVAQVKVISSQLITPMDMGTSVYWAPKNLGASTKTEAGDYYGWGETASRHTFGMHYNKWIVTDSDNKYSILKYNTLPGYGNVDNLRVLLPEDDAARWNLGSNWRIPTKEEWEELFDKEKFTYTWDTSGNIIYGVTIKNKSTGTSIYLPITSMCTASGTNFVWNDYGCYWTADVNYKQPVWARGVLVDGRKKSCYVAVDDADHDDERFFCRYYGMSIRPVRDK